MTKRTCTPRRLPRVVIIRYVCCVGKPEPSRERGLDGGHLDERSARQMPSKASVDVVDDVADVPGGILRDALGEVVGEEAADLLVADGHVVHDAGTDQEEVAAGPGLDVLGESHVGAKDLQTANSTAGLQHQDLRARACLKATDLQMPNVPLVFPTTLASRTELP